MIAIFGVLFLLLVAAAAWLHAERGWFRPTPHQWIVAHVEPLLGYAAAMVIVAIPAALLGALATFVEFAPVLAAPQLELAIAGAESPAMTITNAGDRTAIDVGYAVAALDLDREVERGGNLFLPRPAEAKESLQPGSRGAAVSLWPAASKPLVPNRHRVVGSVTLTCRNCAAAPTYSFYWVAGKEGWYWEQPGGPSWAEILEPPDAAARAALVRASIPADAHRIGSPQSAAAASR